jgi:hypothetical protein
MSAEEKAIKKPTDTEQMILLHGQIEEASAKLRELKDKESGRRRIPRSAWDSLSNAQREILAPELVAGQLILED